MANDPTNIPLQPVPATARGLVLAALLLAAEPASAIQEYILPTLFDVTGVSADDVLNVRAAPDARSEIIGTLAPDARDIEVVDHDGSGRWARINIGGQSGWAAIRYLAYQVDVWETGTVPPTLHCLGTEPFWSFRFLGDDVLFSTPEVPGPEAMGIEQVLLTGIPRDPRRSLLAESETGRMTAAMVPMTCSDGMSDRAYGLDATVILEGRGEPQMLAGCCSIAPQ